MRRRIVVDCETTALEADYKTGRGTIWELAVIVLDSDGETVEAEHLWRMKPDAQLADRAALRVGRYYERTTDMQDCCKTVDDLMTAAGRNGPHWSNPGQLAPEVARLLDGATLIGAVPSFDAGFLAAFLRTHGEAPTWHYRLRDIGSMAYGALARRRDTPDMPGLDASTEDFAEALGVDLSRFERHTALGDCRAVATMLNVIEGSPS